MPATQQLVLRLLGAFTTGRDFYLGGGTAIAIQLGHRRSVDLDWFTAGEIAEPLALAKELRRSSVPFDVTSIDKGTLHGETNRVKTSFLEYDYPALVTPIEWPEYGCRLAALEDLACMKLSAIGDRGAKKDFIDIYALGLAHFTLEQMLDFYQQKFDTRDVAHTVMALTYFDDAEEEEMPEMLRDVEWEDVKRTIEEPFAAYIYFGYRPGQKSVRTEEVSSEVLIDYAADDSPLGIEVVSPGFTPVEEIYRAFDRVGLSRPEPVELEPIRAA